MAAITGAHHDATAASTTTATNDYGAVAHSGAIVNEGYRFIPGLKGLETPLWENVDENTHNEYYGSATGIGSTGCSQCHAGSVAAAPTTSMNVPNNSMSGFCSTCHGNFHSSATGNDPADAGDGNGTSGAFLRHPSDYTIPATGEYAQYTTYDVSAPVARTTLPASASATVAPGDDLVMCLSCHAAHGTPYDYILRFNYDNMTAGFYANQAAATAEGGCLACHTQKGIQQ
jgi:hypothetical protein